MGKGDRTRQSEAKVTIRPKWRPKRDFKTVLKSVERVEICQDNPLYERRIQGSWDG